MASPELDSLIISIVEHVNDKGRDEQEAYKPFQR
jgi:hypothetical protein